MTNKFDKLVDDLLEGRLTLTHIQIAYRTYLRRSKHIPIGTKNILCGDGDSGLVGHMLRPSQALSVLWKWHTEGERITGIPMIVIGNIHENQ